MLLLTYFSIFFPFHVSFFIIYDASYVSFHMVYFYFFLYTCIVISCFNYDMVQVLTHLELVVKWWVETSIGIINIVTCNFQINTLCVLYFSFKRVMIFLFFLESFICKTNNANMNFFFLFSNQAANMISYCS